VKIFNLIRQMITNPLSAAVICVVGGYSIWLTVADPPKAPGPANVRNGQGTGQRTIKAGRADSVKRGSSTATQTDRSPREPKAGSAIAKRRQADAEQKRSSGRREADFEQFERAHESAVALAGAASKDTPLPHRQINGAELTIASHSDAIAPLDPRARSSIEYQTKKAEVTDDASDQKRLALWCDEHGLWQQAKTHWEATLRLNSKSDDARKRLGFRMRGGKWVFDAESAEEVSQTKANAYWKVLERYHARMRCRSKVAVPGRSEAVAQIEAVSDPRAAAVIWKVFAADVSHHGLIVGILSRFKTRESSEMLAALAVYSQDHKAQASAIAELEGRGAAEYGERLVSLMHNPLRVEERQVPVPGRAPARELFVEGDKENYQFLFSRAEAPTSDSMEGCFQPRLSASEIQLARQFNENQAAKAKQALDQQVEMAKHMIEKYNGSIRALNERVAHVLNEACNAAIRPEPEDGRRWLAMALGTEYKPASSRPKPTITEIVSPLYNPTFLPVPVAT
jgi:hypothetical protein